MQHQKNCGNGANRTRTAVTFPNGWFAGPETLRQLASFSEHQIRQATGVRRDTIRLIRHGRGVKRSTYEKLVNFLRQNAGPAA